jgi:hypothetical protein
MKTTEEKMREPASAEDCYERVMAWRKANPRASWRETFENVPNHYSSSVAMYGSMLQVERKRAPEDFKIHLHPHRPDFHYQPRD